MKLTILILSTVFHLIFTPVSFSGQFNSIVSIGDSMPDFDQLPSISGKTVSSTDLDKDIVVFVSLANHCPWVRGMDKDLVALSQQFKNHSVQIIGFSVNHREDDRLPAMMEHASKVGYTFEYIYDESQQLGRELGATRTPEYFVFDKNRKLIYMGALYDSPAKMNSDGSIKHINGDPKEFYVNNAIQSTLTNNEFSPKETRAHGCGVKYVQ